MYIDFGIGSKTLECIAFQANNQTTWRKPYHLSWSYPGFSSASTYNYPHRTDWINYESFI